MQARILEFAELLRHHGLRISPAESMDALSGLTHTGLGDRETVRGALRATMVKRLVDVPIFDELFDVYFSALGQAIRETADGAGEVLGQTLEEMRELLAKLEAMLAEQGIELSDIARALLAADEGVLEQRMREAIDEARGEAEGKGRFRPGAFASAVGNAFGMPQLQEELEGAADSADEAMPDDESAKLREMIQQRLGELQELMKRASDIEKKRKEEGKRDDAGLGPIGEKSFYYLTEEETRQMKEAVAKLAQRIKNVVAVKRTRTRRGVLDLHRTLRKNISYGGVPFDVHFERKRRHKPQIVVLCDVSDSVRNVSRFMLQFVYALQDLYSRVRSFIFVAEIGEVTRLFEDNEAGEALELSLRGDVINVFAHSDFGRAFKNFHTDHLGSINRRTTVIILGDARNNYNLPHEWAVHDIQARARQVIWLNPEAKTTWGFGDSEMDRYRPYCDLVEECRNLNQLYRVVDRLLLA
ncbi:MAG: VWA domain-containing protein [Deltaproteobacteria bacterium]